MDLLDNAFNILKASPRDSRHSIVELAEEQSLLLDPDECMNARAILTTPRKRLAAEIAWLPGVGPKKTNELLNTIQSAPESLLSISNVPSIARANILSASLSRLPEVTTTSVSNWLEALSDCYESISTESLFNIINEERVTSGFPEIHDISFVEEELQTRREHYRTIAKQTLNKLPSHELIWAITTLVEKATNYGANHGTVLIEDIVDAYEIEAQEFLELEESNIEKLIKRLAEALAHNESEKNLELIVCQLIEVTKNWDTVAQPIQVCAQSKGVDHEASIRVARSIRSIAITMFNEYGKLELTQKLTQMLQSVFAEVGEVAERTAQDAEDLNEIANEKVEQKERDERWSKEITYEAQIGSLFAQNFKMSPAGIQWQNRSMPLEKITRLRWGGIRKSVNGIPTGTKYTITVGDGLSTIEIDLKDKHIYADITDRLWKAVGSAILVNQLSNLRAGKHIRYGSAILKDTGIELARTKFFSSDKRVFCPWGELEIWNEAGSFCVAKTGDKKTTTSFSYLDQDNIHVLEIAVRAFFKQGGSRLSNLLGG